MTTEDKVFWLLLLPCLKRTMSLLDAIDPNDYLQAVVDAKNFVGFLIYVASRFRTFGNRGNFVRRSSNIHTTSNTTNIPRTTHNSHLYFCRIHIHSQFHANQTTIQFHDHLPTEQAIIPTSNLLYTSPLLLLTNA